jgi:HD-GYP domain-containing protein (c-di-GMP phosphodiesterase class II)
MNLEQRLAAMERLVEIGIMLTAETKLDRLLNDIVTEARSLLEADGATIYLIHSDGLRFQTTQSGSLESRMGSKTFQSKVAPHVVPLTRDSIVGYVALEGEAEVVDDVRAIDPEKPYRWSDAFDVAMGYQTQCLLTLPLKLNDGKVLGVLQLVNAASGTFSTEMLPVARSLASTASAALGNAQLADALREARMDTVMRLGMCAEYRDKETSAHIHRMAHISALMARRLDLSEGFCDNLLLAAPMHDVGKIGIPDAILQKPGPLTDSEWEVMKTHTTIGAKLLSGTDDVVMALSVEVAMSHHEKWNGKGYPHGKKGEEIPLSGRIVAIADVFDALMSKRCYKEAFTLQQVKDIMFEGQGSHFQPGFVDLLFENLDEVLALYEKYKDTHDERDLFN